MTDPAVSHQGQEPLTQDEWFARYKQRFVDIAGITQVQAQECVNAESFTVLSEDFEDDPEGAADEEMSCWESDE